MGQVIYLYAESFGHGFYFSKIFLKTTAFLLTNRRVLSIISSNRKKLGKEGVSESVAFQRENPSCRRGERFSATVR